MFKKTLETPLGTIVAEADEKGICRLDFVENSPLFSDKNPHLEQLALELKEYFEGTRTHFSISLHPHGSAFQLSVWNTLCAIPYGHTISYSQEANMLKHPNAMRAVGNANGKNPLPILIPCHRVIAKDGSMGGYSGGVWRKAFLLNLEKGKQ